MASGEACGGETRVREREWVWDRRREGKKWVSGTVRDTREEGKGEADGYEDWRGEGYARGRERGGKGGGEGW